MKRIYVLPTLRGINVKSIEMIAASLGSGGDDGGSGSAEVRQEAGKEDGSVWDIW